MATQDNVQEEAPKTENELAREKNFEQAREAAVANHQADVESQPVVADDSEAKTEIPAQPELEESKNPEQVKTDPAVETNPDEPTGTGTGEGEDSSESEPEAPEEEPVDEPQE